MFASELFPISTTCGNLASFSEQAGRQVQYLNSSPDIRTACVLSLLLLNLQVMSSLDGVDSHLDKINKAFEVSTMKVSEKVRKLIAGCQSFTDKCSGLEEAIDLWNFTRKSLAWLSAPKEKPDPDAVSLGKQIEAFHLQFLNFEEVYNSIGSDVLCMPDNVAEYVRTALIDFSTGKETLKKASYLFACTIILNISLSEGEQRKVDAFTKPLKFINDKIAVATADLPEKLREYMAAFKKGTEVDVAASISKASAAPTEETIGACPEGRKIKRLKVSR